jgi:signal transduction histidine kinase
MKLKALALDLVIGLGAAALALLLRSGLDPFLGNRYPFASGYLFIAITVWYFGWRAAAVMTLLFYPLGNLFFVDPRGTFSLTVRADIVGFTINMISSAILIFLGHKARETTQELTRVNAVLDAANKELSENARRKDEFLAVLSHELRNPLAPILIASSMLERPGPLRDCCCRRGPGPQPSEPSDERAARRPARFIPHREGQDRAQAQPRRFNEVRRRCNQSHRALILKKQQTLSLDLPDAAVVRNVDARRFTQIVANIVGNATRHSQEHAEIRVSLIVTSKEILVSVKDNGPGIEEARLLHLFDSFPCRASHGATHGRIGNRPFADQEPGRIARRNDTRFQ